MKVHLEGRGGVVPTYLNSNTPKDDLEFELLLCLASILGLIDRLEPTGVSETHSRGVFVPTHPNSSPTKENLEFEWLLCLASTLDAVRHRWPAGVSEIGRTEGLGGTKDGMSFEGDSKKVLNFTREKRQSKSQELAFSLTD
jgi:hypothetical protein